MYVYTYMRLFFFTYFLLLLWCDEAFSVSGFWHYVYTYFYLSCATAKLSSETPRNLLFSWAGDGNRSTTHGRRTGELRLISLTGQHPREGEQETTLLSIRTGGILLRHRRRTGEHYCDIGEQESKTRKNRRTKELLKGRTLEVSQNLRLHNLEVSSL